MLTLGSAPRDHNWQGSRNQMGCQEIKPISAMCKCPPSVLSLQFVFFILLFIPDKNTLNYISSNCFLLTDDSGIRHIVFTLK